MPKEVPISKSPDEIQKEKPQKPEPVFATKEELAEKESLLEQYKKVREDTSLQGLKAQQEILNKMEELDEKRKRRIAREKGEEIFDKEKGIFENIYFKETTDKKTGGIIYISRHKGRSLVILEGSAEQIEVDKPYKAQVAKISRGGQVIYARIIDE